MSLWSERTPHGLIAILSSSHKLVLKNEKMEKYKQEAQKKYITTYDGIKLETVWFNESVHAAMVDCLYKYTFVCLKEKFSKLEGRNKSKCSSFNRVKNVWRWWALAQISIDAISKWSNHSLCFSRPVFSTAFSFYGKLMNSETTFSRFIWALQRRWLAFVSWILFGKWRMYFNSFMTLRKLSKAVSILKFHKFLGKNFH